MKITDGEFSVEANHAPNAIVAHNAHLRSLPDRPPTVVHHHHHHTSDVPGWWWRKVGH